MFFFIETISKTMYRICYKILKNTIAICVPFFVLGFSIKLNHDNLLDNIFHNIPFIFLAIVFICIFMILFMYFILNNCMINKSIHKIKNIIPAALTGLVTASSMTALPLMLNGCIKNIDIKDNTTTQGTLNDSKKKDIVQIVLPPCLNLHPLGDNIALVFLSLSINYIYGGVQMSLIDMTYFGFAVALSKFGAAGIPGGGMIILMPILEEKLNFSSEMILLMITLDILCDYFITFCNLLGNGFFVIFFDKVYSVIYKLINKIKI